MFTIKEIMVSLFTGNNSLSLSLCHYSLVIILSLSVFADSATQFVWRVVGEIFSFLFFSFLSYYSSFLFIFYFLCFKFLHLGKERARFRENFTYMQVATMV
jgi:hypothetical protein